VRTFAARVAADLHTVDVLIHNAATLQACTNTTDGFETNLQTNYLAWADTRPLFSST
jgi:NAD(P)-dependent dehydrogenase (short-subunit alcohol dehydrogenase family)